jgi:hypothetical protein
MSRRRRRAALAALLTAIAAVVSCGACSTATGEGRTTAEEQTVTTRMDVGVGRSEWLAVSRALGSALTSQQRADGSLRDVFSDDGSSRYGDAIAGYALIQTGTRDRDRALALSGIRAVDAATRTTHGWTTTRCFELWGVAAAYNVVHARLRHLPQARAALERWAGWLRQQRTTYLQMDGFGNKFIVDAVGVLEAQRTGLSSQVPGTILGSGRSAARQQAVALIAERVPAEVRGRRYPVLSDPRNYPIAYHGLSYAAYARAVELLGADAGETAGVLAALGRTAWAATAPDGEIAYWGRSMSQVWSLPALAYGLARTSRGASGAWRARFQATAHRALRRLQGYGAGPRAEWTTPSLRANFLLGRRSLDGYARSTEYTGLALIHLNLAIPLLPASASLGQIAADHPWRAVIGQGAGRFAVVRQGSVWFATRERGGNNLRYDIGPVALKRFDDGLWRDVAPLRPPGHGSAGPVLLDGDERGLPAGRRLSIEPDGTVAIAASLRTREGRVLREDAVLRVAPTSCGVRYSVGARAGDRFEFSAFLRGDRDGPLDAEEAPRALIEDLAWEGVLERAQLSAGLASASDARVSRATLRLRAERAGEVSVTRC